VEAKRGLELKPFVPWETYHFGMSMSLRKWEDICFESLEKIEQDLKTRVEASALRIFRNFQSSGLASAVT
jgi:hypothetical protein